MDSEAFLRRLPFTVQLRKPRPWGHQPRPGVPSGNPPRMLWCQPEESRKGCLLLLDLCLPNPSQVSVLGKATLEPKQLLKTLQKQSVGGNPDRAETVTQAAAQTGPRRPVCSVACSASAPVLAAPSKPHTHRCPVHRAQLPCRERRWNRWNMRGTEENAELAQQSSSLTLP